MKSDRVASLSSDFQIWSPVFHRPRCFVRCVNLFMEDENSCEAAWAVHVTRLLAIELASYRISWDC